MCGVGTLGGWIQWSLVRTLGADSVGLSDELREESGECDWKPLEGVRWCSAAWSGPSAWKGKGEGSSGSKAAWGGAWHNLG